MNLDCWRKTKLGVVAETVTSGSRDWAKYYSDSGSKFVRMTNLRRDGIHLKLDDLRYVNVQSDSSDGKRTSLQHGDILISITAELGKIGWIPKGFGEAYINQHTALVRLKRSKVNSMYVAYLLSSKAMNNTINRLNDSGAKAGLNLPTIRNIPINMPPLAEQNKIANIISTWDKVIETTEKLIANSQQQKKALMQQMLTGKKRFPKFNKKWKLIRLSDVAKKDRYSFTGGPFGSDLKSSDYTTSGVRIIQLQNIGDGEFYNDYQIYTSTEKADQLSSCNIFPGELILSKMGDPVARAAIIPDFEDRYLMASDGIRLEVDNKSYSTVFILELINHIAFRRKAISISTGSTRKRIGLSELRSIKIVVPSEIEEQQKIAKVILATNGNIENLKKKLECLIQEKKALMQQLLTGKRRVKIDEPNAAKEAE